jgi:hypothetical protein
MSDVNVNEDPKAGFIDVAENRERGFVGTLVAWAFIIYPQLNSQVGEGQRRRTYKGGETM